jgi:hypothetical protein
VAAAYLTWRTREGDTLEQALERALDDLDGFYTFVVGTRDGFAVLRDPIACKPAVMAETDDWVAFGTEFRRSARCRASTRRASGSRSRQPSTSGAGAPDMARKASAAKSRLAPARNSTLDLARLSVREVNQLLHDADGGDFLIENPRGLHAIAAGLDGDFNVSIDGPCRLLLRRHEQAGLHHRQRQCRHRRGREHDVGPRAREGRRLAVGGRDGLRRPADRRRQRVGALRHLAQGPRHRRQGLGRAHVGLHGAGGQPGRARRCRRGAGRLDLRGAALRARAPKSLGSDCVAKDMGDAHKAALRQLLDAAGVGGEVDVAEFRRYGSARKLYNFHVDNLGSY